MKRFAMLVMSLFILLSACGQLTEDGTGLLFATADPKLSIGFRLLPAPPAPPLPTVEPQVLPEATATVSLVPTPTNTPEPCLIKGNVSSSGELIYHMPDGAAYNQTVIDPERHNAAGVYEQYFCDEETAQAAGFRRSSQ